jgi:hypothetical protein
MAIYECPRPGCPQEYRYTDKIAPKIGPPVIPCDECQTPILIGQHNEWDFISTVGKVGYLLYLLFPSFVYGLLGLVISAFMLSSAPDSNSYLLIIPLVGCLAPALFIYFIKFPRDVKESRKRLANKEYIEFLKRAGFFKSQSNHAGH